MAMIGSRLFVTSPAQKALFHTRLMRELGDSLRYRYIRPLQRQAKKDLRVSADPRDQASGVPGPLVRSSLLRLFPKFSEHTRRGDLLFGSIIPLMLVCCITTQGGFQDFGVFLRNAMVSCRQQSPTII